MLFKAYKDEKIHESNIWEKTQKIKKMNTQKEIPLNKSPQKLMILIKLKKRGERAN